MFSRLPADRRLAVATLSEAGDAAAGYRGPDGRALTGYVLITGEGTDCRVTVYLDRGAGTPTAVLAGDMVWFQTPRSPEAEAVAEAEPGPEADADVAHVAEAEREAEAEAEPEPPPAESADEQAEVGFKLYHEPATPVSSAIPPHTIEVTVTPVAEPAVPPPDEAPVTAEAPAPPPAGEQNVVTLVSRHPLAPRAGGSARIDREAGRLTMNVRGLPSPTAICRSCNGYRAWLFNQRTGARHSLGPLTRLWGENFRLQSDPDLPLSSFDAVLVTAEDRTAQGLSASAPQVLLGTYTRA